MLKNMKTYEESIEQLSIFWNVLYRDFTFAPVSKKDLPTEMQGTISTECSGKKRFCPRIV